MFHEKCANLSYRNYLCIMHKILPRLHKSSTMCFRSEKLCLQFCVYSLLTCKVVKEWGFFLLCLMCLWTWTSFFSLFVAIFDGLSCWRKIYTQNMDFFVFDMFCMWMEIWYLFAFWNDLKCHICSFKLLLMDIEYTYLVFQQASNCHSLHRSSSILWWCYTQFLFMYKQQNIQRYSVRGWFLCRQIIWSSFGGILHGRLNSLSLC